MSKARTTLLILTLIVLPILAIAGTLCFGRFSVPIEDVGRSLYQMVSGVDTGVSTETYAVITQIRLPRALLGALVGASLAVSGAAFQGLFRNPLVSAGILGVSAGAGFGAALAIVLFSSLFMTPVFAFAFGILAVSLSYLVGSIKSTTPTIMLVLGGTVIQSIFSALLSLVKYIADAETQLPAITFWLMGSLASTKTSDIFVSMLPMLGGMLGLFAIRWRLNVLSMGDREAKTLGINVGLNKLAVISFATLATAGAVSVSGVVGWVGLVVPHIGRMIVGNDNRWLVPASMSFGAVFVIVVDTICRSLTGAEIPLGVVAALVGGPFFIYLLKTTKGRNW